MKLDTGLLVPSLKEAGPIARAAEDLGFDALWTAEASHDPFFPLLVAAQHTERIKLGTAIAVAFPRSPMTFAQIAWDLQEASGGRFILGLGTQVKGHNERRFGIKWEHPVPKLREMIQMIRAVWDCWQNGTRPNFRGQFYNFTLMTPFFSPGPIANPNIPIYIAGVNELICQLAGELCDGFHIHPLHSIKYLRESVIPNIAKGAARAGRQVGDVKLATTAFVITGRNDEEIEAAKAPVRQQISFYASTRTYRPMLEAHGWGDVCERLNAMSVRGEWANMASLITDEMLEVYATTGTYDVIGERVRKKYEGILDRVAFYFPFVPGQEDRWRGILEAFRG